ncbi:MAG: DUF3667 domain-containing protein [Chryseobacterium sp.]|uniref:DUF3667 domain-containing protein n=1 Tax=Chryseobacterium sp. TaxID=1871047 RepID=UPI0025C0785E|nr:DUF3667 domain-containing protein [Chryseobacterium sp.]MCJ7933566.1 DUF3667 domain-containing protein [Chryseobacterium sp.]
MSHGKIREDKTCLNCGHYVEQRFCPHCGQENIESRQPFHFLFTHFIEDFTHYDGQFWKTIQYLFTRPGKLTKEYLAGKRQVYVAPVKLYIFISFITFLLPAILPKSKETADKPDKIKIKVTAAKDKKALSKDILEDLRKEGVLSNETAAHTKKMVDTLQDSTQERHRDIIESTLNTEEASILNAYSMKEYDALQAKDNTGLYKVAHPVAKKVFALKEEGFNKKQIWEKYKENFIHTIPKALFIYLPVFAFFLWLFHNKQKWWYFDHGIFTLHYFSFLLLGTLLVIVGERIVSLLPDNSLITLLSILGCMALITYMSVYFFVAHYRVYETRKGVSILKGSLLFIINYIGLILMLLVLMYLSFIMLH